MLRIVLVLVVVIVIERQAKLDRVDENEDEEDHEIYRSSPVPFLLQAILPLPGGTAER